MADGDITVAVTVSGTVTSGRSVLTTEESITFTSIADVIERTLTCPSDAEITVLEVGTVAGATLAAINCIVFHNTSETISVEVGLIEDSAQSAYFILAPDEVIVMMSSTMVVEDASGASSGTFANIDKVTLQALSGTAVVEMVAF